MAKSYWGLSRRDLIQAGASIAAASILPAWAASGQANPFTQGVASGNPSADGFVLWTRLAPNPLALDGRSEIAGDIPVRWEVATDDTMKTIVSRGIATATEARNHALHVEVQGLKPQRPYWYRFTAAHGMGSRIGRNWIARMNEYQRSPRSTLSLPYLAPNWLTIFCPIQMPSATTTRSTSQTAMSAMLEKAAGRK